MSPHQIIAVAMRLFAAWLGIYVLRTLPQFYFARHSDTPGFLFVLVFFILTGGVVLALGFFPRTIAGKLLSPPNVDPAPSASRAIRLAMGSPLIGLWRRSRVTVTRFNFTFVARR